PSLSITRRPPTSTLFPYTTLFRSLPTLLRFPSLIVPIGVKLENHLSRNLLPFNHITVKFDFCYITVARGRIIVYVAVALLVGNGHLRVRICRRLFSDGMQYHIIGKRRVICTTYFTAHHPRWVRRPRRIPYRFQYRRLAIA